MKTAWGFHDKSKSLISGNVYRFAYGDRAFPSRLTLVCSHIFPANKLLSYYLVDNNSELYIYYPVSEQLEDLREMKTHHVFKMWRLVLKE